MAVLQRIYLPQAINGKYIYAKFACFILLSGLGWVTQVNQCVSFEGEALVFGGNCEGDDATANSSH